MSDVPAPPREAWTEWGGEGPLLCFGHANGFPPETYRLLLGALTASFRVTSFAARPLWPGADPAAAGSWRDLADDLRGELVRRGAHGAIGAGHSLGSVLAVLAAAAEPGLFRALVLVDPVIFSGAHSLFWGAFKGLHLGHRLPLIRSARRRRERFPDRDAVRAAWSGRSVFGSWLPEVLEDYVRSGTVEDPNGGVTLRYPKAWEARIFELTPASVWRELRRIELPMLVLRGEGSDTFLEAAADRLGRELPSATVVELSGCSHFAPMERPQAVAGAVVAWWQRLGHAGPL
ncbi:MAG: alpha/beta hydrolase [Thermoanaerobaculales bacterium]|nr:alpha/beta hydrolase [Thermoanaerobaculales bacterium]